MLKAETVYVAVSASEVGGKGRFGQHRVGVQKALGLRGTWDSL
jgi:hypothetical protein